MKSINVLIVDDEKPARTKIRSYLQKEKEVGSIIEVENGIEAARIIRKQKPDLVFLDIQMPGRNGFEVIEDIGADNMPAVVFVTAYDEYAIEAFEVQAVDYLLKPYDEERFRTSLNRALKQIQSKEKESSILEKLISEIQKDKKYLRRIMVQKGSRFLFVNLHDVLYISSHEKYINLHTEEKNHLIRETMNLMESRLDPEIFARIHRSFIVNISCIKEIQPWAHGDCIVVLKEGTKLKLSRRYRNNLFSKNSAE